MSSAEKFKEKFADCATDGEVHNRLIESICHDYIHYDYNIKNFERFRTKSRLPLGDPADFNVKSSEDILDLLRKEGKFGVNNYGELRKLVTGVHADLPKLIDAATKRIQEIKGTKYKDC